MIDELQEEVQAALDSELYVVALTAALAIPDICGALESETGRATGENYRRWYSDNLAAKYRWLAPEDCYQLRCSMLHQGRSATRNYSRIVFTAPGPITFHNNIMDDTLNLDIVTFCQDIMAAASAWLQRSEETAVVQANLAHLMRWRPDGLAPYVVGVPVLS